MFKTITIIGLGTNSILSFPSEILNILNLAQSVYLKVDSDEILTQIPTSAKYISPNVNSINGLTDAYQSLAMNLVKTAPSVYLVPGDPIIDEASIPLIQKLAAEASIPVSLIKADDLLSTTLKRLQISPSSGLQILDATLLCSYHYPPLESSRPVLITGIYHTSLIELLQNKLKAMYQPSISLTGITKKTTIALTLDNLVQAIHSIYIPPQTNGVGLTTFQETIAHLRAPNGCPWDREQTHQSLRPYLLEETYEVLSVLDANDMPELADELGDLLLQIALHAQIASESGHFHMKDIIHNINQKIIRRHPHVFGNISASNSDEVKKTWAAVKAEEKAKKGKLTTDSSILDNVQLALPALAQALDISQKAVNVGFEWAEIDGVLEKLVEEAHEIATANSLVEIESEMGDFLFVAVNLARKLNVDPESALRGSNARFMRRFKLLEKIAHQRKLVLTELDKTTWQSLWQEVKQQVAHLE